MGGGWLGKWLRVASPRVGWGILTGTIACVFLRSQRVLRHAAAAADLGLTEKHTTSSPPSRAQASATQLFDDWNAHCGRATPAVPAAEQSCAGQRLLPPPRPAGTEELQELENGDAAGAVDRTGDGAAAAAGELLGDAEERRSWWRRLRWAGRMWMVSAAHFFTGALLPLA